MKITTKTGDTGETSLFGGGRVSKGGNVFIELVGQLDELQSLIGWARCGMSDKKCQTSEDSKKIPGEKIDEVAGRDGAPGRDEVAGRDGAPGRDDGANRDLVPISPAILNRVQDDLYRMMSIIGFKMKVPGGIKALSEEDVGFLEEQMEILKGQVEDVSEFIRPGSCEEEARLNVVRAVCRRVEREFVRAALEGGEMFLKYLNRLSDLLFVMGLTFCR